jgi:cytochrome c oxidase assembly protein subunit 15
MNGTRKLLFALAVVGTVLTFVVILLGAWTRLRDAGLGCPDWPGCYGFLHVPVAEEHQQIANARFPDAPVMLERAWPEMVHRYFATGLGALILLMTFLAWRAADGAQHARRLITALLVIVIVQGMFGMWTVTWKLWPQVVTAHLLGGMATVSLMWLLTLRLGWPGPRVREQTGLAIGIAALVAVVLQIALGGWTTSNYAALACPDFPTCQTQWIPPMDFAKGFDFTQEVGPNYLGGLMDGSARVAIHFSHRVGAIVASLVVLALVYRCLRSADAPLRQLGLALLGILTIQILLGISNVVFTLPLKVAIAHNGVAAVLLLTLVSVNYRLFLLRSSSS